MWESRLFKTGTGILLFFLIIWVGSQITFIFYPLIVAIEALFFSFFIAGALFYLGVPLVDWLHNHRVPRPAAIAIFFLVFIGLITLLFFAIGPILQQEFTKLAESIPGKISEGRELLQAFEESLLFAQLVDMDALDFDNLTNQAANAVSRALTQVATSVTAILDFTANLFVTIIIIPFLVYYMLKEKGKGLIAGAVTRVAPQEYSDDIESALTEMNRLLGSYVKGLAVVCLCVGILAYIGFLIIGLEYALILSIFIMITNVVPFLGPFIGAIPAVIIGLLESPLMMLLVIIVIVIVQQLESLLVSPQVMGRRLALNPLAIILIVLVAGRLGGLLGIILAIPTFTVLKIIIAHIYERIKLKREQQSDVQEGDA